MLASALALVVATSACNYGFQGGGGFPRDLQTVFIEPFENETPQFDLEQQLFTGLLDQLPRSLGVRPAGREVADVIVRGRILHYDDAAQDYRRGQVGGTVEILEHQVRLGVAVEIIDVRRNVILWDSRSLIGLGNYRPGNETEEEGRQRAIENLIRQVLDGAQSQW